MGQYHILHNIDKNEEVHPHKLGLGLKQVEHAHTVAGLPEVLYMLLTASPNRGGGDLDISGETKDFQVFGRWCGDRVVVLGDYTEDGDIPGVENAEDLYCNETTVDITDQIIPAFQVAFNVQIHTHTNGWRERSLEEGWNWLVGTPYDEDEWVNALSNALDVFKGTLTTKKYKEKTVAALRGLLDIASNHDLSEIVKAAEALLATVKTTETITEVPDLPPQQAQRGE